MNHSEFYIGLEFWMAGQHFQCADVGTRTAVAMEIKPSREPSFYNGPPYAILETVFDENVQQVCSIEEST